MLRKSRKAAHIKAALEVGDGPGSTGFEDVFLVHCCLPELTLDDVSTSTWFLGRAVGLPIIINAITGGPDDTEKINAGLAEVAADLDIPMAVGSQTTALEDPRAERTYRVVRKVNPKGLVMANVGADVSPDWAKRAVEMIEADALQVHLNAPQELFMNEGDRDFRGCLERIGQIVRTCGVPVIAKEVGFGVAAEEAAWLVETGVQALDIGGKGGTNFIAIEAYRRGEKLDPGFLHWGIPTAVSLVEVAETVGEEVEVVASGGIRSGEDLVKALALGARMVGMAGPLLRILALEDVDALRNWLQSVGSNLKKYMLMMGAGDPSQLPGCRLVITGRTAEWLQRRGYDINRFACRTVPRT